MLYYFKKGKNTAEMQKKKKKICAVGGEGAVIDRTCQQWFVKFPAGQLCCWTMLHSQGGQLKLIVIKWRH